MHADWAVELSADDPVLTVPWSAGPAGPRFHDLKRQPELLLEIAEASGNQDLAEFLVAMNSAAGPLESAKRDTWSSRDITPEEEFFGASGKFGSCVELLFTDA